METGNIDPIMHHSKHLIRSGVMLVLFGLLTGFFVHGLALPLLGVAAHLIGIIGGIFLIAGGAAWPRLRLSRSASLAGSWMGIYGFYATWAVYVLAGAWGAGGMFPLAAGQTRGTALQEGIIAGVMVTVALALVGMCILLIWGLRGHKNAESR